MICTRVIKDKDNLAGVVCICKVDGIERWLRNQQREEAIPWEYYPT